MMPHSDRLKRYHSLLLKWQKAINLISPSTVDDAWNRHFVDSVQLLKYMPDDVKSLCDIGSGAGFPGLVIAIENPDIQVSLIESDARKCAFLRTVSRETNCKNVTIYNSRIEAVIEEIDADLLTARALASLRQLIIYSKSLWINNLDFKMILPKGQNYQVELDEALLRYDFSVDSHPSVTLGEARILIVGNIREK